MGFFVGQDLLDPDDIRNALEHEVDSAGPDALMTLNARLMTDNGWGFYPRDPLARQIHHFLADRFLDRNSQVVGTDHLPQVINLPVTILANHLSYADANVIEILLKRAGGVLLADRLTAIAGPKVFTSRQRRFSSLCFGTIKAPQSTEVSSEEAVLSSREVARAARQSINVARSRLGAGDALLIFGEGTRSRTGGMQRMIAGVARYLEEPGSWVMPVGLSGSEVLYPIGASTISPAYVRMRLGCPIRTDSILSRTGGDRRVMMDALGLSVAELLPVAYRGVYRNPGDYPEAGDVLHELRVTV